MKSIFALALLIAVTGFTYKPTVKTYHYFCSSRAIEENTGSPMAGGKATILLSPINSAESVDGDLSALALSWGSQVKSICTNEEGCTSDLNLYPTKEMALAAQDRIRTKYADQSKYILKDVEFELKKFKIIIEKNASGIMLKSLKGSAWEKLSFSLDDDRPQAVDGMGMTTFKKDATGRYASAQDFLFTITKTKEGILLKGVKGTAWKELSFTLLNNQPQAIDQNGMTN
ncbi:MAG: hypothetical protein EOO02_04230 [Chitinophagaceae bacterium]|nr:MAG: hypothetical protein EOO02_04230 [Chitinophagaceae bacterium]